MYIKSAIVCLLLGFKLDFTICINAEASFVLYIIILSCFINLKTFLVFTTFHLRSSKINCLLTDIKHNCIHNVSNILIKETLAIFPQECFTFFHNLSRGVTKRHAFFIWCCFIWCFKRTNKTIACSTHSIINFSFLKYRTIEITIKLCLNNSIRLSFTITTLNYNKSTAQCFIIQLEFQVSLGLLKV